MGDCHPVVGMLASGPPKLCSSGVRVEGIPPAVEVSPVGEGPGLVPSWLGDGLVMASFAGSEEVFFRNGVGVAAVVTRSPKVS